MSLEKETPGQYLFPVPLEENNPEAGTEVFDQEEEDQNGFLSQEMIEFLEYEQGIEIPCAEVDLTSSVLDPIPLEKDGSVTETDDGLLMFEEIEQNELFQEINQFLDLEEIFQIPCTETMNSEQDPTPGPSSGENKDLDWKENKDRGKEEIQEAEEERKTSAPSKTGSNGIKKRDFRGKCGECNKIYLQISCHSKKKHNGKMEKCTASRDCKEYFASVQKRTEHEQKEHSERKKLCCQMCNYSTEWKSNLKRHVRLKHSEKEIKCGQQKCETMYSKLQEYVQDKETVDRLSASSCGKRNSINVPKDKRLCERCEQFYALELDANGDPKPLDPGNLCRFHPGKLVTCTFDCYYLCCSWSKDASPGCSKHEYHVSEDPLFDDKSEYVSTADGCGSNRAVFALDCEMCITKNGFECARVSIVDENRVVVYDALVKPETKILDYVTQFSGITRDLLEKGPTKTLKEVQEDLLRFIKKDSILIGHSIDHDLKALKLHHDQLVDTAIVFPHQNKNSRHSLRWLADYVMGRKIRNHGSGHGHDSAEDAKACMDLMRFKVGPI
ncbi:exonuclease GOR-like [Cloeon dipterum]|uniref:exonuclease GOR-like n=1 Tax=Cloeon dipterum TaxID=197152 RepID=UPI00321F704F